MKNYDVVVVGAGPAGGYCATMLARSGYSVLLVEQSKSFAQNNFSSAVVPLETLARFNLPSEVVGSFWQKITLVTTSLRHSWDASHPLGAVLDFARLREFWVAELTKSGGEVWMGCRYLQYAQEGNQTTVFLRQNGEKICVSTKVLVDATGFARAVMYQDPKSQPAFLTGSGWEYLIEVEPQVYQKYADALFFFLGYKWMPKGYAWIFPMGNNRLKVGVACLNSEHKNIGDSKSLKYYLERVIQDYMQIEIENYQTIERHGSILKYSSGLKDLYYQDNLIAIGDSVSTVNFLGGEGIRHAMLSSEIACKYLQQYLNGQIDSFKNYQSEMQQIFARKWNQSEKISRKVYLEYSDRAFDRGVKLLQHLDTEDVIDILFNYRFKKMSKGLKYYLPQKLLAWLEKVTTNFLSRKKKTS